MNLPSRIRRGSAVRGAGVAVACVVPGLPNRARAVLVSYGLGWPLDRAGIVIVADDDAGDWQRVVVPFATSALAWTLAMTTAASLVRRTALPAPVAALLLGGAVVVGDAALIELGERIRAGGAPPSPEA